MTPEQLHYLIVAVKQKSFAKAAKSVFCTPQTVSRAIAELERDLGTKLFDRTSKGVVPTPFAIELAKRSKAVLRSFSELKDFADSLKWSSSHKGRIRLGVLTTPYRGSLLNEQALRSFNLSWPEIEVNTIPIYGQVHRIMLEENIIDAAFLLEDSIALDEHCAIICSPKFVAIVSRSNPLSEIDELDIKDLDKTTIAMPFSSCMIYSRLKMLLQFNKTNARFQAIHPTLKDQLEFIGNGGVILAFQNASLATFSKAVFPRYIPLSFDLACSAGITYARVDDLSPIPLLIEYLRSINNKKKGGGGFNILRWERIQFSSLRLREYGQA